MKSVRGKGLLNAVVVDDSDDGTMASKVCTELMRSGLLAKPTQGNIIRLAPPLCITEAQVDQSLELFEAALRTV